MNPQTHRLIFNKSRGGWMAVGENALSCGDSGTRRSRRRAVGAMDTRHVEKSTYSRSLMWQKTESEGYINQTLHLPKIHGLPPGAGAYQGAGGVSVQLPAGSSVRTQIEALSGQPGLEYLGELGQRSDIDWKRVEVINQSLNINKQGLTPEGMIVVAIAVSIALGPQVGMSLTQAAGAAALATLATTATVSLINNGGDLGETLKVMRSKETMRAVALSAATAGLTQGALEYANLARASDGSNAAAVAKSTAELTKTGAQLARGTVQGLSAAMAESAILGTSFEEALGRHLTSSLIASLGAMGADEIGTHFDKTDALGKLNHKIAHAVLGCAVGAASADSSEGCAPGAVGAVIGELVAEWYADTMGYDELRLAARDESNPNHEALKKELAEQKHLMAGIAQLAAVGGTAVLLQAGAEQLQLAKMTANNAAANNRALHPSERALAQRLAAKSDGKFSVEQIENALRNSGNTAKGEGVDEGMVVRAEEERYDKGAVFVAGEPGSGTIVQVLPNQGQVDADLASFIVANTGGSSSPYGWLDGQLGKAQPVASHPNAQFGPNWSYMGSNSASIPSGTAKVPDGSYGVGLYTPVGGGEIEVEIKNNEAVGAKVGIGVGLGGHANLGTKKVEAGQLLGPTGGGKSAPLDETNPQNPATIRVGSSITAGAGIGTVGAEASFAAGVDNDGKSTQPFKNTSVGNLTVSPVLPKIQGEIKVNIIEISVKAPEEPAK